MKQTLLNYWGNEGEGDERWDDFGQTEQAI